MRALRLICHATNEMVFPMLTVIPAIDLKDGRCVRLRQGLPTDETIYSEDPLATAQRWVDEGCEYLHVVDLDGAFLGKPVHSEIIGRIAASVDVPVETGGGLRTAEDIRRLLDAGVERAIVGTSACEHPEGLAELVGLFEHRLAVGIDARDGLVRTRGWAQATQVDAVALAKQVDAAGIQTLIYTDTAVDGMMTGVNLEAVRAMCGAVSCQVIASGGIAAVDDIVALRRMNMPNLIGAIVGKVLYERRTTLARLLDAATSPLSD